MVDLEALRGLLDELAKEAFPLGRAHWHNVDDVLRKTIPAVQNQRELKGMTR